MKDQRRISGGAPPHRPLLFAQFLDYGAESEDDDGAVGGVTEAAPVEPETGQLNGGVIKVALQVSDLHQPPLLHICWAAGRTFCSHDCAETLNFICAIQLLDVFPSFSSFSRRRRRLKVKLTDTRRFKFDPIS